MIKILALRKRFKNVHALNDINVEFNQGEVIALIGPNGSGKTTLIKSILGLVTPESGSIFINGTGVTEGVDYRKEIGYMPQIGRYPENMKVGQLFRMLKEIRNSDKKIDEELFYKFKLDTILNKSLRSLSGGTRQKVSAAIAFLFDPEILILDEPTAGLDPLSSEILKEKILAEKEKGKLILITSHILSDLEQVTTNIMYIQDGKLIFYKTFQELQKLTGEENLTRAIAWIMNNNQPKNEFSYLKIAL